MWLEKILQILVIIQSKNLLAIKQINKKWKKFENIMQ